MNNAKPHNPNEALRELGHEGVYPTQAKQENPSPLEPFVDAVKAGDFLTLRPRRVLELARQGRIPGYPLGNGQRRVWRFRLSELASALTSSPVKCPRQSPAPRQEMT